MKIIGISGSLRSESYNTLLLRAGVELAPAECDIQIWRIDDIPLYNAELDNDERRPESVQRLKSAIDGADGVIWASPEYNHSIPGVLKNVIDWVSRPAFRSPLADKPVTMMGASPGRMGTIVMQQHLRAVLAATTALIHPARAVAVNRAKEKFADGRLVDEVTRSFLQSHLESFVEWIDRVKR